MPNSPNVTLVPPLAIPRRRGWCCLRCLTLRGISIGHSAPLTSRGGRRNCHFGRRRLGCLVRRGTAGATSANAPGATRPAQPATALDLDALGAALHRALDRLAHGTAECDAAGQLLGHALSDELRVDLRVLDLEDVQLNLLAGQLLEVAADPVGLRAAPAD